MIKPEEFSEIKEKLREILSELEWKVVMCYLDGKSYQEIAGDVSRNVKAVDNALQRAKRKLERYLDRWNQELDSQQLPSWEALVERWEWAKVVKTCTTRGG